MHSSTFITELSLFSSVYEALGVSYHVPSEPAEQTEMALRVETETCVVWVYLQYTEGLCGASVLTIHRRALFCWNSQCQLRTKTQLPSAGRLIWVKYGIWSCNKAADISEQLNAGSQDSLSNTTRKATPWVATLPEAVLSRYVYICLANWITVRHSRLSQWHSAVGHRRFERVYCLHSHRQFEPVDISTALLRNVGNYTYQSTQRNITE
jgi:hypothetical protein